MSEPDPTASIPSRRRPWRARLIACACLGAAAFVVWHGRTREAVRKPPPVPVETGARLDVRVYAAGQPIEGAHVTVTAGKRYRSALRSDADGEAHVTDCPRAPVSVMVEAGGLERAIRAADLTGQDSLDLRVELSPGARVTGRVHDEADKPVAGVVITVRLLGSADPDQVAPWYGTTLYDGSFSIDTLPVASITLEASAGDAYEPAVVAEVDLPTDTPVEVLLRRMGTMTGRVISQARAGVAEARVTLAGSGVWPPRSVATNAQGDFRFERVPDGIYEVRAEHESDVSAPLEGLPVLGGNEAHVELMLSPGLTLRGAVRDIATGHALPNVQIDVSEESLSASLKHTRSGGDGRYQVSGLRSLLHRVSARSDGYVAAQTWATPGDAPFDLELLRAIIVTGSVQDEAGRPVPQAEIEVSGRSVTGFSVHMLGPVQALSEPNLPDASVGIGNLGVTQGAVPRVPLLAVPAAIRPGALAVPAADGGFRSDEQGRFRLEGLPPGELTLAAHKPGFVSGRSRPLQVRPGEALADVVIVLPHGELLSGRVVDGHGMPLPHVRIELSVAGEPARSTVSASNGSFRFDATRGDCTLLARPSAAPLAKLVVAAHDVGRREVEFVVESAADKLAGRVLDAHGQPIESATIHVETDRLRELAATALSGADGSFEFGALPPPPYRVRVDHPNYAPSDAFEVASAAKPLVIRLTAGADLAGTVSAEPGGEPIAAARLTIQAGATTRSARSNRQGSFEFRHLPVGAYTLSVDADGFMPARDQGELIETTTSSHSVQRVTLVRAGRASGEVVDRLGATVWNAEVTSGSPPAWERAVRTNHAGHFVLGQLRAGDQRLSARHHGLTVSADQPMRVYEGQESPGVVLRFSDIVPDTPEPAQPVADTPSDAQPSRVARGSALGLVSQGSQVVVDHVGPGSPAARSGLQLGDVLLSVDGEPVRSAAQARGMLTPMSGSVLTLEVRRGGVINRLRYPLRQ